MFFHIYKYRIKCTLRDKEILFWSLAFSFILAILFNIVLQGAEKGEAFTRIPVAVIETSEFNKNAFFKEALLSTGDLFDIYYTDKEEADKLLDENKINGYILYEEELSLVVRKSGIQQTIIKSFLDEYKQMAATIGNIERVRPEALSSALKALNNSIEYIADEKQDQTKPDIYLICYYSLIAMACLYAGNISLKEVASLQADASAEGARLNAAPVNKMKMFLASIAASATVSLAQIFLLMLFSMKVMKVDFGDNMQHIVFICFTGVFTGVLYGALIGGLLKGSINKKVGTMVALTMVMCFLSGMMTPQVKHSIESSIPLLSKINLISLITDSLYSLYYYSDYSKYTENMIILWGFNIMFSIAVYLVMRRRRYASI